jgi:hypothetical protein
MKCVDNNCQGILIANYLSNNIRHLCNKCNLIINQYSDQECSLYKAGKYLMHNFDGINKCYPFFRKYYNLRAFL